MVMCLNATPRNQYSRYAQQIAKKNFWYKIFCSILICCILIAIAIIWTVSLTRKHDSFGLNSCPPLHEEGIHTIDPNELRSLSLLKPDLVKVRVLNATSKRNAAKNELNDLKQLGFIPAENPMGNDKLYPINSLMCPGQLRFGIKGKSAAATLAVLYPCSQFLIDTRKDTTVDLVMGLQFSFVPQNYAAQQEIAQLHEDTTYKITSQLTSNFHCPITLRPIK